jgi:diguanylate cyclase (GGDEF)-like protein/PAS domain S-box-containing protein
MGQTMPTTETHPSRPSIRELLDARPTKLLALGFATIVVLMIVLGVSTLKRINQIRSHLNEIVVEHNFHSAFTYRMLNAARNRSIALHRIVFDEDPFVRDSEMLRFYALATEFGEARNELARLPLTAKEEAVLAQQGRLVSEVLQAQQKVIDHVQDAHFSSARAVLFDEAMPAQLKIYDSLGDMIRLQQEEVTQEAEAASRLERQAHRFLLVGGSGAVLLSIVIAMFSIQRMRVLMRGIRDSTEHLEETVAARTADLQEREEILRRLTTAANDAVVMIDEHDTVTFWNHAAEKIFRYTEQEALGRNVHDLIMPERYRSEFAAAFAIFSETGRGRFVGQTRELIAQRRGGEEFPVELSVSAVMVKGRWHAIGLVRDITDRKHAEAALNRLATTDPLTGVANRRKFDEVLDAEVKRSARYGLPLTLLLFDIDHFKEVNDRHGHLVGDQVLSELARLVSENVRVNDHFARWGGEEFAVLATHCDENLTEHFAEKLRMLVGSHDFPTVGRLSCSFGLSGLRQGDTTQELVARADEALYRAKSLGRNRVCRARQVVG